jgi:4-amino-4-deoxychorismate lyase
MSKLPEAASDGGVFETLAVVKGEPRLLARHLARLAEGSRRLNIKLPAGSVLAARICEQAATAGAGVVKVIASQKPDGRGEPSQPIVRAEPPRLRPLEWSRDGISVIRCRTRFPIEPHLAGLKLVDRQPQLLARREWTSSAIAEGLMLDSEGRLVGGTMTNVYAVIDDELCTPAIVRCGVAGVMRASLLQYWQRSGTPAIVRDIDPGELNAASELFVSNALIGIWPVRAVDGQRYAVGPVGRTASSWVQRIVKDHEPGIEES